MYFTGPLHSCTCVSHTTIFSAFLCPVKKIRKDTPKMAMLAETRKKQKWSLNPKGSAWVNDSSKFGEKLLRKMGWSDGQGLGAQKQGITEHIKVRVKHDSKGLGFKDNDQVWVEVENDFSNLLSTLSSKNEKSESESSTSEIPVMSVNRSLEEQSKKSKSRVHYQKFTRGKDLSRYSKKDLECIFGVSSKSLESKHEENQNFVQSGNMQEYFSKKNVKNRKSDSESPTEKVDQLNDNNESEDVPKKKKKKGKKRKHEDTEFNEDTNREFEGQEIEDDNTETNRKDEKEVQTKGSKKNTEPVDIVEDENVENSELKVKKKSKKNTEPVDIVEDENAENSELKVEKKSKKNTEPVDIVEDENAENSPLKVKKKKKKKSKSELVIPQLDGTYDSSEVEEFMVEPTEHLESNCCIANIGETFKENTHSQQISQKSSCKTSKKRTKLNKNPCVLDKVKSVLEALPLSKEETVPNLNEKNEEMSKHVDAIVQAKINTYLNQVLNRKEKNTNPVREMKEKKKKMIQDDVSCVQFSGSNLCSISGYTCY